VGNVIRSEFRVRLVLSGVFRSGEPDDLGRQLRLPALSGDDARVVLS
jgi:hypothetical protein